MNLSRLTNPEAPRNLDIKGPESFARRLGGYTLGLLGYASGIGAVTNTLVSGGLSLPILGGLSTAFFAGSRALMRPTFQDSDDYESVKDESTGEKAKRLASFVGGFAVVNAGANLLFGGLFNALPGISMNAPVRVLSAIGGLITTSFGARVIQGSFDPKLHEPRNESTAPKTLRTSIKDIVESGKTGFRDGRERAYSERAERKAFYAKQREAQNALGDKFIADIKALQARMLAASPDERANFKAELAELSANHKQATDDLFRATFGTNKPDVALAA